VNTIFKVCFCFFFFLSLTSAILAQNITGTVHNQTTDKPSIGDEVLLIRLGEGMEEEARGKTGNDGAFTLNLRAPNERHFVRVIHQGVNYDQMIAGTAPLQIIVYDAVATVPGLSGNIGIAQIESDGKTLKVTEMYAITNASNPPVTQSRPDNYPIALPPKAALDSVEVRSGKGMWVKIKPSPIAARERTYGVNFPIRPGDTLFKFVYRLPYRGRATLHLHLPYPIAKFGIVHPPSMRFKALRPNTYSSPGTSDGLGLEAAVSSPLVGDVPAFEVSGVGTAPPHGTAAAAAPPVAPAPAPGATNPAAPAHNANPANAGDQARKELWLVVGGMILILAISALAVWRVRRRVTPLPAAKRAAPQGGLLEALKEELFQLESDRLHGSISAEEYATTKDALNQSIQRALSREKR